MKLTELDLKHRNRLERFFNLGRHYLSVYSFENIYIWKSLFRIYWAIYRDSLLVFFQDNLGCFLYLPVLSKQADPEAIAAAFSMMDKFNQNQDVSRIENAEEADIAGYRKLGYECQEKYPDYLCLTRDLAELRGDKFKAKRASSNYFVKHYSFEYLPFSLRDRDDCLQLYDSWSELRGSGRPDPVYKGMLQDSRKCLGLLLRDYRRLNLTGRVVRVDNAIKGFTFGFKLSPDTFCISYEVTDLSIKGLSQFIFRSFCRELREYKYINIMDDSGLENLKRTKLSYHPVRLVPAYIVKRK